MRTSITTRSPRNYVADVVVFLVAICASSSVCVDAFLVSTTGNKRNTNKMPSSIIINEQRSSSRDVVEVANIELVAEVEAAAVAASPAVSVTAVTRERRKDQLTKMTVIELKDQLRTIGLTVSGKKVELIDRLLLSSTFLSPSSSSSASSSSTNANVNVNVETEDGDGDAAKEVEEILVVANAVDVEEATGVAAAGDEEEEEGSQSQSNKSQGATYQQYTREIDPDVNAFDVDVVAVNALLLARGQARTDHNYQLADILLSKLLKDHAVIVNDSFQTWKTATKKELKKLPKIDTNKSFNSRSTASSMYSPDSDLYVQSLEASPIQTTSCSLSEETIVDRIAERRRAQKSRDFDRADSIRNSLKREGVYLQDGPYREWRADGIPFGQRSNSRSATEKETASGGKNQRPSLVLMKSKYSLDLQSPEETTFVENLIAQRSQSKAAREYDKADYIRDKLYETYDIRIDDKLGEWSVGGQFVSEEDDYDNNNNDEADGYSHWSLTSSSTNNNNPNVSPNSKVANTSLYSYEKSSSSMALPSPKDEEYIQQKVNERMRAKRTQNYELADTIRDELFANWDVTIHDKINKWSVGGKFDDGESWNYNVNDHSNGSHNMLPGDDKSS